MGIQRELLQLIEIAGHGTCCLRTDSWENFVLPLPPLTEQKSIEAFLKSELAAATAAVTHVEREIALLSEYRTRLTADVVTGKLDVREAARHLPADEEKSEEMAMVDKEMLAEGDDEREERDFDTGAEEVAV